MSIYARKMLNTAVNYYMSTAYKQLYERLLSTSGARAGAFVTRFSTLVAQAVAFNKRICSWHKGLLFPGLLSTYRTSGRALHGNLRYVLKIIC